MSESPTATLSESQRSAILSREVAKYVGRWASESVSATQAVMVKVKKIGLFWNVSSAGSNDGSPGHDKRPPPSLP